MRTSPRRLTAARGLFGIAFCLAAGSAMRAAAQDGPAPYRAEGQGATSSIQAVKAPSDAVRQLLNFNEADVKFSIRALMVTLRDHRHEGWVLWTYADPTTHLPLIGAGFSLDLVEREHPQRDPWNPHPFFEPSSAQLWQAAGLDPEELPRLLRQFNARPVVVRASPRSRRRAKLHPPAPQISEAEAERLLRISIIQSILNAKAYCRDFDSYSASQQMALTQLVYQMGVNLEEFNDFLSLLNGDPSAGALALGPTQYDAARWAAAQQSLVDSRWARLYRSRAIAVIALLDPHYLDDPAAAEMRIAALLPAPVVEKPRARPGARLREASYKKRSGKAARKPPRVRRKA